MYACICHAVTERVVAGHVRAGAETIEEVGDSCLAGTGCGTCHSTLDRIIEQHASARPCVLAALQGERVA